MKWQRPCVKPPAQVLPAFQVSHCMSCFPSQAAFHAALMPQAALQYPSCPDLSLRAVFQSRHFLCADPRRHSHSPSFAGLPCQQMFNRMFQEKSKSVYLIFLIQAFASLCLTIIVFVSGNGTPEFVNGNDTSDDR